MLEDDNMAWGPTKVRKVKPTPPYVQPPSHYLQKASHHAEPESHYVRRAETLESENVAQWSRVPKGRKMKPASQYVERAELLEEDNRAWWSPHTRALWQRWLNICWISILSFRFFAWTSFVFSSMLPPTRCIGYGIVHYCLILVSHTSSSYFITPFSAWLSSVSLHSTFI